MVLSRKALRETINSYETYFPFPLKADLGNFLLQVIYSSLWVSEVVCQRRGRESFYPFPLKAVLGKK